MRSDLLLEPTFLLMYWMGFTYTEAMNLPLTYRRWFIERLQKELNKRGPNDEGPPNRGAESNTAEIRQMQGRTRDTVPAKLRRFT